MSITSAITSAITDPRSIIGGTQLKGATAMSFPPQLDGTVPNFFELKFVNYDRNATLTKANQSPNSTTIFLPVPKDLSDNTDLSYDEYQSFGGLDRLMQNGTSSDFTANLATAGKGFLAAAALTGVKLAPELAGDFIAQKIGLSGAGDIGKRLGQVASTQAGALVNPALAVEFRGVQRKTYQFVWSMVARSQDESTLIAKIVNTIRWNILPEKVQGDWILTYPNIAFMKFHGGASQLIQFAPQGAVVTNMIVSYNGNVKEQVFFQDSGEPVQVQIGLQLSDRGILTRDMIKQ